MIQLRSIYYMLQGFTVTISINRKDFLTFMP
ncbi:hypothetical protein L1283_003299 [Sphingobacterium sp. HSC-15S19]